MYLQVLEFERACTVLGDPRINATSLFSELCTPVDGVAKRVIACFFCGLEGHIASGCPKRGRAPAGAGKDAGKC